MTFTTYTFLVFLGIFFPLYWLTYTNRHLQNFLVLVASYIFYGWWDWRFLGLIFTTTLVDYACGLGIARSRTLYARRLYLILSLVSGLGMLGFFKYFNFFVENFELLLSTLGFKVSPFTLRIILPVGISFYTLQSIGYVIDVYRGHVKPSRDPVAFFAYVSFFPQLVAGPIERADSLLVQFYRQRRFDYDLAIDGLRQIGWGFFKKILIADNLDVAVVPYFESPGQYTGGALAVAVVFFGFQIYCDFSAYSDIAIGLGKLFGFRIRKNFNLPYFATSFRDFWSRWHMSLTTWLRDYLYVPLGGNRRSLARTCANILTVFLVSGLWHGAQWTFVAWGAVHGMVLVGERLTGHAVFWTEAQTASRRSHMGASALGWIYTFTGVMLAWTFFRASSIGDAFFILGRILSFETLVTLPQAIMESFRGVAAICFLFAVEALQRHKEHPLQIDWVPMPLQQVMYLGMVFVVVTYGAVDETPFIYFQF